MSEGLSELVRPHIRRVEADAALQRLYAEVDERIGAHQPVCTNRGACCKFGSFGHQLYVTSLEVAYFAGNQPDGILRPRGDGTCPYQAGGQCTARERRPLGCRVFFCDPASRDWQGPEYEVQLGRLKALGEALGVEYRYVEWLSALEQMSEALPRRNPGRHVDGRSLPVIR